MTELPVFVEPMLATPGAPFDSPEYIFEIKWDGYRAIVRSDAKGTRLWSRNRKELTTRFSELALQGKLPPGSILDGEVVILRDGVPDFGALQRSAKGEKKGDTALVVFDLLYLNGASLMGEPLLARRELLAELVRDAAVPRLLFSDGIVGSGKQFFEEVGRRGLEGMTAKRLDSAYLPGRRTEAWFKIKHRREVHCAVVGFLANEAGGVRSLSVAADLGAGLCYVGQVGSGLGLGDLRELKRVLGGRRAEHPIVPCPPAVVPVLPGVYCVVSFVELTREGMLRAPVCESWAVDAP